jgi:hypothetical protein
MLKLFRVAFIHKANQQNTIEYNILISFISVHLTLINLKKLLTSVNANLCYSSNVPKNIPIFHNVMAVH